MSDYCRFAFVLEDLWNWFILRICLPCHILLLKTGTGCDGACKIHVLYAVRKSNNSLLTIFYIVNYIYIGS